MDNVKMAITEEKNATVYTFGYAYTDRGEELKWVDNAIVARRTGDKWAYDFNSVKNQTQSQFNTYQTMVAKVLQITEGNATNLFGVQVERPKAAVAVASKDAK